jgi:nucleotide-binding universal stress UspA family protein
MFQRALVVFENQTVLRQAVDYARELAKRMDCEVTFLMLVEMAFLDRPLLGKKRSEVIGLEEMARGVMRELVAGFIKEGLTVSAALRVGDPAQEMIKFLAESPPFQVIVWGSGEELPDAGKGGRSHWLTKVAGALECPLLTVQPRQRPLESVPARESAGEQPMDLHTGRSKTAGNRGRQQGV